MSEKITCQNCKGHGLTWPSKKIGGESGSGDRCEVCDGAGNFTNPNPWRPIDQLDGLPEEGLIELYSPQWGAQTTFAKNRYLKLGWTHWRLHFPPEQKSQAQRCVDDYAKYGTTNYDEMDNAIKFAFEWMERRGK